MDFGIYNYGMGQWRSFGSSSMKKIKARKSLSELEAEIEALKKARDSVKSYNELEKEKAKLKQEIRQEGFKQRHKTAFTIIDRAQGLAQKTYANATSPKAKRTYKKTYKALKKEMKKL